MVKYNILQNFNKTDGSITGQSYYKLPWIAVVYDAINKLLRNRTAVLRNSKILLYFGGIRIRLIHFLKDRHYTRNYF